MKGSFSAVYSQNKVAPHYSHGVSRCHRARHAKIPQSEIFSPLLLYYFCPKNN